MSKNNNISYFSQKFNDLNFNSITDVIDLKKVKVFYRKSFVAV